MGTAIASWVSYVGEESNFISRIFLLTAELFKTSLVIKNAVKTSNLTYAY
jgi:hypothetical protein